MSGRVASLWWASAAIQLQPPVGGAYLVSKLILRRQEREILNYLHLRLRCWLNGCQAAGQLVRSMAEKGGI